MKILCPTDFSDHSIIAMEYAFNLANDLQAEIHVLSVYQVQKSSTSFIALDDIIHQKHEENMKELLVSLGSLVKEDNAPVTKVASGGTVSTIARYANQMEMDLIVMGTQGGNSLRTILFGSTTKKLASKVSIPILAIPEVVQHRLTSNKIILAIDNQVIDDEDIFSVPLQIATFLDQKIDVLHIDDGKPEHHMIDPFIKELLKGSLGDIYIEKAKDPVTAIKQYAELHNIGLLIMIRREKSFMQRLLALGNTSAELATTNIPLMILPE